MPGLKRTVGKGWKMSGLNFNIKLSAPLQLQEQCNDSRVYWQEPTGADGVGGLVTGVIRKHERHRMT